MFLLVLFSYVQSALAARNLSEFLELRFRPLELLNWAWNFLAGESNHASSLNDSSEVNLYGRDPGELCHERWIVDAFFHDLAMKAIRELDEDEGKLFVEENRERLDNIPPVGKQEVYALTKRNPGDVIVEMRTARLFQLEVELQNRGFFSE
jgi:hypothetical protein